MNEAVIVFDGVCVLCNGWVRFLLRHDHGRRFRFAAMQSEAGQRLLAMHGLDAADPSSFLLLDARGAHVDSDAVLDVLAALGWPWRAVTVLRMVPRALRDAAYRTLARNRYRWFGRHDACVVPDADQADRFL